MKNFGFKLFIKFFLDLTDYKEWYEYFEELKKEKNHSKTLKTVSSWHVERGEKSFFEKNAFNITCTFPTKRNQTIEISVFRDATTKI